MRPAASRERLWNLLTAVALFVALPLLTEHAMPRLVQQHQYLNLDVGVAIAVAAVSLNLLLGYAGQLSLGHSALLASGAFASGIVVSRWHGSMVLGLLFAVGVTAAISFVVGLPALRLRGEYLAIVTLIFGVVMQYSVLRSTVVLRRIGRHRAAAARLGQPLLDRPCGLSRRQPAASGAGLVPRRQRRAHAGSAARSARSARTSPWHRRSASR